MVVVRPTERGLQSAGVLASEGGIGISRARLWSAHGNRSEDSLVRANLVSLVPRTRGHGCPRSKLESPLELGAVGWIFLSLSEGVQNFVFKPGIS
jgi:hypothetical protein